MMEQEVPIPVYFTHWNPSIDDILTDLNVVKPSAPQPAKGSALDSNLYFIAHNLKSDT